MPVGGSGGVDSTTTQGVMLKYFEIKKALSLVVCFLII